jgi:hypothetical protein
MPRAGTNALLISPPPKKLNCLREMLNPDRTQVSGAGPEVFSCEPMLRAEGRKEGQTHALRTDEGALDYVKTIP